MKKKPRSYLERLNDNYKTKYGSPTNPHIDHNSRKEYIMEMSLLSYVYDVYFVVMSIMVALSGLIIPVLEVRVQLAESNIQTHHNDESNDGSPCRQHTISAENALIDIKNIGNKNKQRSFT